MHIISPQAHGYLDYVTVIIFLAAPMVLGLMGVAAVLSYVLAGVHLAMTLATRFPLGIMSLVPFPLHGWVERIVGPVLIVLSFIPAVTGSSVAMWFYLVMGVVITLVGFMSRYRGAGQPMSSAERPEGDMMSGPGM